MLQPPTFTNLCQRGILEIVQSPDPDAGPVEIFMASQVILVADAITQTGDNVVATGDNDLSGIYAVAMQQGVMLASFKAHVKYPYRNIPVGQIGHPILMDDDERTDPALFEARFIPEPDNMVIAFSIFLSYCAAHGSVLKILETSNPPCITTGFLDVVVIDSHLAPGATVRQKRQFDTTKDWNFILDFVKSKGYQSSPANIWLAFNALGMYRFENELVPMLGMFLIYIQAIRDNDPRIAIFKEKRSTSRHH